MTDDGLLKFTDAHYIALGKLLVAFQSLEIAVASRLMFLMYPHPDDSPKSLEGFQQRVLMELPFKKRIALIPHFIRTLSDDDKPKERNRRDEFELRVQELNEAVSKVYEAEETRNRIIHSHWIGHGMCGVKGLPSGMVVRTKFNVHSKRENQAWDYVSAEDILNMVNDIEAAEAGLIKCAREVGLHLAYTRQAND